MVQYTYVEIVSKYYGQMLADAYEHNIVCVQSTELDEQLKHFVPLWIDYAFTRDMFYDIWQRCWKSFCRADSQHP